MRRAVLAVGLAFAVAACGSAAASPDLTLPRDPASVAAGTTLYEANCARCHGADLNGGRGPSLSAKVGADDAVLAETVRRGRGLAMPSFGDSLTEPEITSIIDYVRSVQLERRDG